jgi:hypothetical protein
MVMSEWKHYENTTMPYPHLALPPLCAPIPISIEEYSTAVGLTTCAASFR